LGDTDVEAFAGHVQVIQAGLEFQSRRTSVMAAERVTL